MFANLALTTLSFSRQSKKFVFKKSIESSLFNMLFEIISRSTFLYPNLETIYKASDFPEPIGPVNIIPFLYIYIRLRKIRI